MIKTMSVQYKLADCEKQQLTASDNLIHAFAIACL